MAANRWVTCSTAASISSAGAAFTAADVACTKYLRIARAMMGRTFSFCMNVALRTVLYACIMNVLPTPVSPDISTGCRERQRWCTLSMFMSTNGVRMKPRDSRAGCRRLVFSMPKVGAMAIRMWASLTSSIARSSHTDSTNGCDESMPNTVAGGSCRSRLDTMMLQSSTLFSRSDKAFTPVSITELNTLLYLTFSLESVATRQLSDRMTFSTGRQKSSMHMLTKRANAPTFARFSSEKPSALNAFKCFFWRENSSGVGVRLTMLEAVPACESPRPRRFIC